MFGLFRSPKYANTVSGWVKWWIRVANAQSIQVRSRKLPKHVRVSLFQGLDKWISECDPKRRCFGVSQTFLSVSLRELCDREGHGEATVGPMVHDEIDVGDEEPILVPSNGLWLLTRDGQRYVVLVSAESIFDNSPRLSIEIAGRGSDTTRLDQTAKSLFSAIEDAVKQATSFRGKMLSLEGGSEYEGTAGEIRVFRPDRVTLDDLILEPVTADLLHQNVVEFAGRRELLARRNMRTMKGLLFYGPPGNGKTHSIRYLANALPDHTTLVITADEVAAIREYLALARLLQPAIVVIEDADLIARRRSDIHSPCEEALLNRLLNELDGLGQQSDLFVILTTNRPESLEEALAGRPGRVDQAIEFPHPGLENRRRLARLYAGTVEIDEPVIAEVAERSEGMSAAFIRELMRRATECQLRREADTLEPIDVREAIEQLLRRGGSLNARIFGFREPTE